MAETPSKRLRQDRHAGDTFDSDDSNTNSKRQKSYNSILSLLDEEEENEEQNQELSAILTTLQQELSSSTAAAAVDFEFPADEGARRQQTAEGDAGVEAMMRHLLEASDDELGIPNYAEEENNSNSNSNNNNNNNNDGEIKCDENISPNFWEFDDVAANYYTVLQSELLM